MRSTDKRKKDAEPIDERVAALAEGYAGSGKLLAIATRNARGKVALAEESVQEALCSFMRRYDPDGEAPSEAWLVVAMKRDCWRRYDREHYDKRAGQELGPDEEGSGFLMEQLAAPDSMEDQVIERVEADRRLGRLKPDERASVELQGAGFSYAEIAEHMGWTYTKVHRSVKEGRRRLKYQAGRCA